MNNADQPQGSRGAPGNQNEPFHASQGLEFHDPGSDRGFDRGFDNASPIGRPRSSSRLFVLLFGVLIVAALAAITLIVKPSSSPKFSSASDDLGAGISQASGLRGHLVTRWQGKAQYMLKMEPLDPRNAAGFSAVAANPSKAISINIRLLDSAGFALCGKEIDLRFDPAHAPRTAAPSQKSSGAAQQANLQASSQLQKARQSGKDVFENIRGSDGSVEALWAEGELPCSPDQYKKFDYWDLSTNFPTLDEQDALLGHVRAKPQQIDEASSTASATPATNRGANTSTAAAANRARRKLVSKAPVSTFYVEGDDQVSMYEPSRALLTDDSGRSFLISSKIDQTTAAAWAANYSHIHFKCDQHANCALRAGSGTIFAKMND